LNRARILEAALRLADAAGFRHLTMRRLAEELGAAPMAVYTHFRDKDELLWALLDHVVGRLEVPSGDWEQALRGFARAARRTLLAHPGVVPLFTTVPALLPNSLRLGEAVYAVLRRAGFADEAVVRSFYAVLSYTLGYVALEVPRRQPPEPKPGAPRLEERFFADLPRERLPLTAELAPLIATFASDAQFQHGLERLLRGIAADHPASGSPAVAGRAAHAATPVAADKRARPGSRESDADRSPGTGTPSRTDRGSRDMPALSWRCPGPARERCAARQSRIAPTKTRTPSLACISFASSCVSHRRRSGQPATRRPGGARFGAGAGRRADHTGGVHRRPQSPRPRT
jgi:AcrR family transcriptional regulator